LAKPDTSAAMKYGSGFRESASYIVRSFQRRLRREKFLRKLARFLFRPKALLPLEKLGSDYGGWVVPSSLLSATSVCYCAGVGEDITFDLALIQRFGCDVHAFDPTPRSARHVASQAGTIDRYHFLPVGLWSEDAELKFYVPRNREHVSHSIVNLQQTDDYFVGRCRRLSSLMAELGHAHLDLLKLDIEGAEYAVLQSMLADRILPKVLCVEFDQPMPFRLTLKTVRALIRAGYQTCSIDGWNFTFVRES
jgi:FkbM family methyltransferase